MVRGVKTRILSALAAIAALLTALGGLDLSGVVNVLPEPLAAGLATALPMLVGIVHLIRAIGDFADDGKINGSFKCPALIFALALVISMFATSCSPSTPWHVITPYGDARGDADGTISIVAKPIIIPTK